MSTSWKCLFGWPESQWCRCDPTPGNCCFVQFVDTILSTQENTVDCNGTHKAVYSVGRAVYEPPRDLPTTNLGGTCFFNLISKSAVEGQFLDNGFALTEKSVMCLETQLLDFTIYKLTSLTLTVRI